MNTQHLRAEDGTAFARAPVVQADPVAVPVVTVSDVVVDEAEGTATFVFTLSAPGTQTVTVNYSVTENTADGTGSNDFTPIAGSVVFAAGSETPQTVTVSISNNVSFEYTEAFFVNLSVPVGGNATLAQTSVRGFIADNDTAVTTPNVSVRDVSIDEGAGIATFVVALDGVRTDSGPVSVNFATSNDTAAAGSDYAATSGSLVFGAGETVKTVQVAITNDTVSESQELFDLVLSGASGATIADGRGTALIGASDGPAVAVPVVTVTDRVVSEADGWVDFTFQLSTPATQLVSVNYTLGENTADGTGSNDFTPFAGTLVFNPGVTLQTLRVPITGGFTVEDAEAFFLYLSVPAGGNATLAQTSVRAHLIDNDRVVTTPNVSVRDVVVDEKAGVATFVVSLDGVRTDGGNVSVGYTTANGTAFGGDFAATSGTLTFGRGETVKTIQVALTDDALSEGQELFDLVLSGATGANIADGRGTALIGASDGVAVAVPVLSVADVVTSEGDGWVDFTLKLSAPSTQTVTANYSVGENTADGTGSNDFTPFSGTVVFNAGVTTQTVRVPITAGVTVEDIEAFFFTLSLPAGANATLAQTSVRAHIVDNDRAVTAPNVSVRDVTIDETTGVATFVVALDGVRTDGGNVSVNYGTADRTAAAGSDYVAASGTLTFGAGETVKTVQVVVRDDATTEAAELFDLALSSASGATIADGRATAVIGASDGTGVAVPVVSVGNVVVSEADGYAEYTLTLSAPATQLVNINYSLGENTADGTGNNDFTVFSGSLVFNPGVTTQTLRVPITNFGLIEAQEAFFLYLTVPAGGNATLAQSSVRTHIVDNDSAVTTPNIAVRDVIVDEKAGVATFVVALDGVRSDSGNVSVSYTTANGSAAAGSDYAATSGTLTFGTGETVKTVQVSLTDDGASEAQELFDLVLSGSSGGTVTDARGTAVIGASDGVGVAVPVVSVANVIVSEADGYTDFVLRLSAPGTQLVTVNFTASEFTADGTGSADFTPFSGVVIFNPGVTTQVVRVPVSNVATVEGSEFFNFTITVPVGGNATVAQPVATGTIVDDDGITGQVLAYGFGNDTYTVDQAGDVVVENVDAGTDTVLASVTRTLETNVDNLTLTGSAAINGTGNALANALTGNGGNNLLTGLDGRDTLNGGAGADTLVGGAGNDTYLVNSGTDRITEGANAGTDTVQSTVSWTLGTGLERLTLTGTNASSGTGNALANTLVGNASANVLDGKVAADTLTGGAGADIFVFSSALAADVITDFVSGVDQMRMDQAVLPVGDGDTLVEGATSIGGPGGFTTAAEFVVVTANIAGALTATSAAAAIGSATTAYAVGDTRVFAVDNGGTSALYLFTSADADAAVSAAELSLVVTLQGTPSVGTADLVFGASVLAGQGGRGGHLSPWSAVDQMLW